jgi:hypothetical protein
MSVKSRLAELNARLAEKLTAKGVEASADETTTALIDKVDSIEQGGTVEGIVLSKEYFAIGSGGAADPANYLVCTADMLDGLTILRNNAFAHLFFEALELPNSIISFGQQGAFYGTTIKQPFVVPDTVTNTGIQAFMNSKIEHITMGANVTEAGSTLLSNSTCHTLIWRGDIKTATKWTFSNANKLANFSIGGKISASLTFTNSPLTIESAKNIINALEDYVGTENEFVNTITFSSTTLAYLEEEGATSPNGNTWLEYAYEKGWNY